MDGILIWIFILIASGIFDKDRKQKKAAKQQRRIDEQREKMQRYQQQHEAPETVAELDAAERRARLQELRRRAAARRAAEEREQAAPQPLQQSLRFDVPAAEGPQEECYGAEERHSPLVHRPAPTSQPRPVMPRPQHQHGPRPQSVPQPLQSATLAAALSNPEQLRQAVILSEVLGPPKALRKRKSM